MSARCGDLHFLLPGVHVSSMRGGGGGGGSSGIWDRGNGMVWRFRIVIEEIHDF